MAALKLKHFGIGIILFTIGSLLAACGSPENSDSIFVEGNVPVAYVKRPVATLGNPTDSVKFSPGGDLFMREQSSPSATEINITGGYTQGKGDVSDPEVSYDGTKILFSMRGPNDNTWHVWEYDTLTKTLKRIIQDDAVADQGNDVDPAYLSDGRIVFSSDRQQESSQKLGYRYLDEYEREVVTVLHVMNADGTNIDQISFNQSHDRNPTVLLTGEIIYARWDHVGRRNQFSVFKINPDGTDPFILYGAHSPGNSYLHPREMPSRQLVSTLMPLSGTREGGSLEIIDVKNFSENNDPAVTPTPVNILGDTNGQYQASKVLFSAGDFPQFKDDHGVMRGRGASPLGRFSTPFPLWDGSNRMLVSYTLSQPVAGTNALGQAVTVEGEPRYGIFMLDLTDKTLRPLVLQEQGMVLSDPIALQARPLPKLPSTPPLDEAKTGVGMGILNIKSVYDTDGRGRMGSAVLATASESIPLDGNSKPDIASMKHPAMAAYPDRVARFFRITKALPVPPGLNREVIGETEFEMQQIVGHGVVEPDGSITTRVPANTPVNITVLDKHGRGFTHHTNWIQARSGETRTCNGCHSDRRGTALNGPGVSGTHPLAVSPGETMSETRVNDDDTVADLVRDLAYQDIWTSLYNARDGSTLTPGMPITVSYDDLNAATASHPAHATAIPTPVSGPAASCTGGNWSSDACAMVINYEEHIQPIWDNHCVACHSGATPAGDLDLSGTLSGFFGRFNSYQELMVGDPDIDLATGLPRIELRNGQLRIVRLPPLVESGNSRSSRLVERIYEEALRGPREKDALGVQIEPVCSAGPPCPNGMTDHANMLNASEKRIIGEWADLGGQYFNDAFDGSGNVRRVTANLSQTEFAATIHPILMTNCATCHQAFGGDGTSGNAPNAQFPAGNRFVLTGNVGADFNVTATMVNDVCTPDNSFLLSRPSSTLASIPPHPEIPPVPPSTIGTAFLPVGSPDYVTISTWIANASTSCP